MDTSKLTTRSEVELACTAFSESTAIEALLADLHAIDTFTGSTFETMNEAAANLATDNFIWSLIMQRTMEVDIANELISISEGGKHLGSDESNEELITCGTYTGSVFEAKQRLKGHILELEDQLSICSQCRLELAGAN